MEKKTFVLTKNDSGRRLDRVIRKFLTDVPLSKIYGAIRKGLIRINGKRVSADYKTSEEDVLTISLPVVSENILNSPAPTIQRSCLSNSHTTQALTDIPILLQTDDLLVINKPAGIPVHGQHSIATILSNMLADTEQGLSFKPGPLHRLDKDTTGILCFSRTLVGAQWFSRCLHEKTVDKYYLGIVCGAMSACCIETGQPEKKSITHCYPILYNRKIHASLMLFRLITGTKHQIRKHTQHVGHPLAGDRRYGGYPIFQIKRYLLHAWRLYFPPQRPVDIPLYIEAPFFQEMALLLSSFFSGWEHQLRYLHEKNTSNKPLSLHDLKLP